MKTRASLLSLLAVSLTAATAEAAEIRSEVECVRLVPGQQTMPVSGTGFTPDGSVTFTADGQTLGSAQADAAGNVGAVFYPPSFSSFDRLRQTFSVAASDGAGVAAPAIQVPMTRIAVKAPSKAKPTKKVMFRVFGFQSAKRVYLHLRRDGKNLRRVRLGKTKGACGNLVKKMRYLPLKRWSTGTYEYHFSHTKTWSEQTTIYILRILFYRTFS